MKTKTHTFSKFLFLILLNSLNLYLSGCKKEDVANNSSSPPINVAEDNLSALHDSILASCSINNPQSLDSLVSCDGTPMQQWIDNNMPNWNDTLNSMRILSGSINASQQRIQLINMLISASWQLSQKKYTDHHLSNGLHQPDHWGLAYSYGQRNYMDRLKPPSGNLLHKSDSVFGLDCSGYLINIFHYAGINLPTSTVVSNFEQNLRTILPTSPYNTLKLVDKGNLPFDSLIQGDIVIWYDPALNEHHIGIMSLVIPFKFMIYQSNGNGKPNNIVDQINNRSLSRGVHPLDLNMLDQYFTVDYKIMRLKRDIEIGDTLAGGVVFYVDSTGNHGFVCANSDQSSSTSWSSALSLCSSYNGGGYNDWTLPDRNQLDAMYLYKIILGGFNISCVDFHQCSYWTSESNGTQFAWCKYFTNGTYWSNYDKTANACARAVRAF